MTRNDSSKTMSDPSKLNLIVGVLPYMVNGAPWAAEAVVLEVGSSCSFSKLKTRKSIAEPTVLPVSIIRIVSNVLANLIFLNELLPPLLDWK